LEADGESQNERGGVVEPIQLDVLTASLEYVVAFHRALSIAEAAKLLPELWKTFLSLPCTQSTLAKFVLLICAEMRPSLWHDLQLDSLYNIDANRRGQTLRKLGTLFQERRYVFSQKLTFDNPFGLPANNLERRWEPISFSGSFKNQGAYFSFNTPNIGTEDILASDEPEWILQLKAAARRIRSQNAAVMSRRDDSELINGQRGGFEADEALEQEFERRRRIETQLLLFPNSHITDATHSG
jgi:hypothetical protein